MTETGKRGKFALSFRATELEARSGICAVAQELRLQGVSEETAGDIEIALAEAINNIVEHAYAGVEPGQIRVICSFQQSRLDIRISDKGVPLPSSELPEGAPAIITENKQDLPEGGFGWFLIRQLTSDIRYDRLNGHNRLSMGFDLT
ncbi:ATP-binding protein [Tropicibacter sp. R16_0]|uniref:ATP-binding protein n=1 Tax=Tropicibacter sp. R16_0 TaxID=2821102 RepID=UPI001ADB98E2|nr:ATP-binding protein [Tropicibacter sp. R16_0]